MSNSVTGNPVSARRRSDVPVGIGPAPFRWPAFTPILAATVVLFALSAVLAPRTMSSISLGAMVPFAAILAVAAVGQTLVVQQRGIDLSVGGGISLAAVIVSAAPGRHGLPLPVVVVLVLVVCAIVGLLNSVLISQLMITPLVATLAVNALLIGAVLLYTNGSSAAAPEQLGTVVGLDVLGLPLLVWLSAALIAVMAVVTTKTVVGRQFVLSGANPSTAVVSGIKVQRNIVLAYVSASVCYGIAGMLLAGYLGNVTVSVGAPYLMSVIAVVIVGGTPLTGGRGTIVGTAISALFLSQLIQLVLTLGAPTATQMLIQAVAITVAAILGAVRHRGLPTTRRKKPS